MLRGSPGRGDLRVVVGVVENKSSSTKLVLVSGREQHEAGYPFGSTVKLILSRIPERLKVSHRNAVRLPRCEVDHPSTTLQCCRGRVKHRDSEPHLTDRTQSGSHGAATSKSRSEFTRDDIPVANGHGSVVKAKSSSVQEGTATMFLMSRKVDKKLVSCDFQGSCCELVSTRCVYLALRGLPPYVHGWVYSAYLLRMHLCALSINHSTYPLDTDEP